jgi:hypothetical protein
MSQDITYEWLAGKWGNELTHISQPPNSFISNYLCQFLPSSDTLPTEDKNKQIDSGSRQMMLLPGHGYLKNFLADRYYMSSGPVSHVKDDNSQQRVSDRSAATDTSHSAYRWHGTTTFSAYRWWCGHSRTGIDVDRAAATND